MSWGGMHPSVLAAIASAEGQVAAASLSAGARVAVEPKVADIRAKGSTDVAETGLEGTKYGAETQEDIEIMKILSQLGGATEDNMEPVFQSDGSTPVMEEYSDPETGETKRRQKMKLKEGARASTDFGKGTIQKTADTQGELAALQAAIEMGGGFGSERVQTGTETKTENIKDQNGNPIPILNPAPPGHPNYGLPVLDDDGNPTYHTREYQAPIWEDQDKYDFGEGKIAKETASQKEIAKQQIDAQLGLGNIATGTIEKTAAQQRETDKAQAQAQLGLGDFAGTDAKPGGIIAAQSRATIEQQQDAAKDAKSLSLGDASWTGKDDAGKAIEAGMGDYASLGQIASQGIESRLGIQEQAQQDRDTMDHRQKALNTQQKTISELLNNVNNPIMGMFGMGGSSFPTTPPADDGGGGDGGGSGGDGGSGEVARKDGQSGLNALNPMESMFTNAGLGGPQTEAMNFLQSGSNPFDVSGMAGGMANAGGGANRAIQANMGIGGAMGDSSLLALQGGFDSRNALDPAAAQQFAQTGQLAGGNVMKQLEQQRANKFAMQQPFAAAAGTMQGATAAGYGASLQGLTQLG